MTIFLSHLPNIFSSKSAIAPFLLWLVCSIIILKITYPWFRHSVKINARRLRSFLKTVIFMHREIQHNNNATASITIVLHVSQTQSHVIDYKNKNKLINRSLCTYFNFLMFHNLFKQTTRECIKIIKAFIHMGPILRCKNYLHPAFIRSNGNNTI